MPSRLSSDRGCPLSQSGTAPQVSVEEVFQVGTDTVVWEVDVAEPEVAVSDGSSALQRLKEELEAIDSALGVSESALARPETSFDLPIREVLKLVPAQYIDKIGDADLKRTIPVVVDDLFEQLARGKVSIPISKLILSMPPDCLMTEAHRDDTLVALPLPIVVRALDPALLTERTAPPLAPSDLDEFPDPFADPTANQTPDARNDTLSTGPGILPAATTRQPLAAAPSAASGPGSPVLAQAAVSAVQTACPGASPIRRTEAQASRAAATPVQHPARLSEPPTDTASGGTVTGVDRELGETDRSPSAPRPARQTGLLSEGAALGLNEMADEEVSSEGFERLRGVDLNRSSEEQLEGLPGVTPSIAKRIVEYRASHGLFRTIFDLQDVPHIGRTTFRRMTGMPFSARRHHRIRKLRKLLGLPASLSHHLPTIAARMAEQPGFVACVISGSDGLLLAQYGAEDYAESLSALAPRMMGEIDRSLNEMGTGAATALTVAVVSRVFTVVKKGDIFVSATHARRKLNQRQLALAERVAEEVAWLLSRRAYVAPSLPA